MKKIIAFVLAMVMTMAMAACASSTNVEPVTNGTTAAPAANATTAPTETEAATLPDETKPVPPTETEPAPTEPADAAEAAAVLGTVEGDTYTNEYLGFTCDVGDFEIADVDELAEINGLPAGSTAVDIWRVTADEEGACVFSATSKDGLNSAYINVRTADNDTIEALDLQAIMEAKIESFTLEYQEKGYVDIDCEYRDITIAGRTLHGLLLEASYEGAEFGLLCFMFTGADFAATVTLLGFNGDALLALVASINAL